MSCNIEREFFLYRNGHDTDTPIDEIISKLNRKITPREMLDVENRQAQLINRSSERANSIDENVASLRRAILRENSKKYVSTLLKSLNKKQFSALCLFAEFNKQQLQTPLENYDESSIEQLWRGVERLASFIDSMKKQGLFGYRPFRTLFINKNAQIKSDDTLESLNKIANSIAPTLPETSGREFDRKRAQQIREQWAELEHDYNKLTKLPHVTVAQINQTLDHLQIKLETWLSEANDIFALDLVEQIEMRLHSIQEQKFKEAI